LTARLPRWSLSLSLAAFLNLFLDAELGIPRVWRRFQTPDRRGTLLSCIGHSWRHGSTAQCEKLGGFSKAYRLGWFNALFYRSLLTTHLFEIPKFVNPFTGQGHFGMRSSFKGWEWFQ
jgi:hypothetical protein